MKTIITLLLCIFSFSLLSQENTIKIRKKEDITLTKNDSTYTGFTFTSFGYSQKFYKFNFQNELKSLSNIEFNNSPANSISINLISSHIVFSNSATPSPSSPSFPGIFGYQYIIPTQVTINDTSIQTLNGYNLNFSLAGQRIISKPNFSLFITEGFRFGRIKNPINALFVASVMRVSFSYFSIFATAQYDLDFSPKKWRKMWFYKKQEIDLPNFSHSGLEFRVGINFSLNKLYQKGYL